MSIPSSRQPNRAQRIHLLAGEFPTRSFWLYFVLRKGIFYLKGKEALRLGTVKEIDSLMLHSNMLLSSSFDSNTA